MREANDNRPRRRCPICGRPPDPAHRPFCSPRCKDVDLGRWLTGSYVIQTNEEPEAEEEMPRFGSDES
jgi:uncharacterized protein